MGEREPFKPKQRLITGIVVVSENTVVVVVVVIRCVGWSFCEYRDTAYNSHPPTHVTYIRNPHGVTRYAPPSRLCDRSSPFAVLFVFLCQQNDSKSCKRCNFPGG